MLGRLAQSVHANEPMALRYQVHREVNSQDGSEDIVMIEQYTSLHPRLFFVLGVLHNRTECS